MRRNPYRKKKRQKKSMFITAQLLRKTNLAEIFSEARSGTIPHKNKKRIMAVTHYAVSETWLDFWELPNANLLGLFEVAGNNIILLEL